MSRSSTSYQVTVFFMVAGILFSMIPQPVWGAILDTPLGSNSGQFRPNRTDSNAQNLAQAAEDGSLLPLLPDGVGEQMMSMGLINESGTPEGMLFDQGALEQAAQSATQPAALADPISISRVQSAYVPIDSASGRVDITFTVTNNRPPETLPLIADGATITQTLAALDNFDVLADPSTIRNVIIADTLAAGISLATSDPLAETSAGELLWNLGDIPPLGTITATLGVTIPTAIIDFTPLDSGATVFGSLKGREVRAAAGPAIMGPDAFGPYLRGTVDANITDEYLLRALGEQGSDPLALFAFVQGMGFEAYEGSLRGTRGTLWSDAGNSVDQSSLLIALLRASGTPARYAHGTLAQPQAQELILSMFPEPVSVVGHIPAGTLLADPANDPELLAEASDHWWVQAYSNGAWVDLDPSFAAATPGQTFTTATEDVAELPDPLRHKLTLAVKVEQYNTFSLLLGFGGPSIIRPLEATFNSVELVGEPVSFNQLVDSSGQGFIISVIQHKYVPVFTVGEEGREIVGQTYQDVFTNFAGGLGNRFSTALWVEVTNSAPDGSSETFEREIIDLIGPAARQGGAVADISGSRPDSQQPYTNQTDIFQVHAVTQTKNPLQLRNEMIQELMQNKEKLIAAAQDSEGLDSSRASAYVNEHFDYLLQTQRNQLNLIVADFLASEARFATLFANSTLVLSYPDKPKLILLSQSQADSSFDTSFELLNVREKIVVSPEQVEDAAFAANYVLSMATKATELVVLRSLSDEGEVVSALNIMDNAVAAGIETVFITEDNAANLARLDITEEAKARIAEAIKEGAQVVVPRQMVTINGELDIGWLQIDESGHVEAVMGDGQRAGVVGYIVAYLIGRTINAFLIGFISFFVTFVLSLILYYFFAILGCFLSNVAFGEDCSDPVRKGALAVAIGRALFAAGVAATAACAAFSYPALGMCTAGAQAGIMASHVVITGLLLYEVTQDPPLSDRMLLGRQNDTESTYPQTAFTGSLSKTATLTGSNISATVTNGWNQLVTGAAETLTVQQPGQTFNLTLPAAFNSSFYAAAVGGVGGGSNPAPAESLNFATALSSALINSHLLVGEGIGTLSIDGQPQPIGSGFALANYSGTLSVQETSASEDQIDLNGQGLFYSAAANPPASIVDPGASTQFSLDIDANISDVYTVTVDAPDGWTVDVLASGVISATPDVELISDDYTLLVTAQSTANPAVFVSTPHVVTVAAVNAVNLAVVEDALTTVPMGPVITSSENPPISFNGHVDNGQVQIPGAAYVIVLENASSVAHTYQLNVSGPPAGYTILSGAAGTTSKTVTLAAGQTAEIGLYVQPNDGTLPPAGTAYNIQVSAVGVDDPSLTAAAAASFSMPTVPFPFIADNEIVYYAEPDSLAVVELSIANIGNGAAAFPITTTVFGDIYRSDVYTDVVLAATPAVFSTGSLPAGGVTTATVTIDTAGTQIGERYIIESRSAAGAYQPTGFSALEIVSPEALQALQAAAQLQNLNEPIAATYATSVAETVNNLVANITDPAARTELIAVLTAFVSTIEPGPGRTAIEQVIVDLTNHTDPAALIVDLTNLGTALTTLGNELAVRAAYPYTIDLTPGASGALPGEMVVYTLSINNQGDNSTTYQVDLVTPAGPSSSTTVVNAGATTTIDVPVSSTTLSYYAIEAQTVVLDGGLPLTGTTRSRTAAFNVVDRYVDVLAVNATPNFVETGSGSTEISVAVANVINAFQPLIAATTVISPDGAIVYTDTLPVNIVTGVPQIYTLNTVDTSTLAQGVYTITVDLVDGNSQPVPNGSGYTILGVGQSVEASHSVFPEIVPPGNITVTTTITTEAKIQGSPSAAAPGNNIVRAEDAAPTTAGRVLNGLAKMATADELTAPSLTSSATITPTGYLRTESQDPALLYAGPGWGNSAVTQASAAETRRSRTAGDVFTATVNAEWVALGLLQCTICGQAEIFVDGVSQGVVDTYARSNDAAFYPYNVGPGTHTVEVVVQGTRSPFATSEYVYVDYIDSWDGSALPTGFVEQDDARILRTNNWGNLSSTSASSGTYFRDGSSAWFPFTGDSVTFQALAYNGAGQVQLRLDGQSLGFVDLYNPTTITRTFSIDGLTPGVHLLQVQAHRGRATIDGFNSPAVEPANIGLSRTGIVRYEENDLALRYNGVPFSQTSQSWTYGTFSWGSRGYGSYTRTGGDSVALTFDGTWVNLGFITRSNAGLAEIFIDGVSQGTFDTYTRYDSTRSVIYDGLAAGTHTIEIVALDQRNANASDDYIHLDYIDVWDGTTLSDGTFEAILEGYEEDRRLIRSTNWSQSNSASASDGTYLRSGSSVWFPFTGDTVSFQHLAYNSAGRVEIVIDGQNQGVFDLYNPSTITRTVSFDGLGSGPHVMQVLAFRGTAVLDNFTTPGAAPFFTPPTPTGLVRYEENHPAFTFNGTPFAQTSTGWNTGTFNWGSRGYAYFTRTGGDTAALTFDGTWISVGFVSRTNAGIAELFIDGVSQGTIDTYSRYDTTTSFVYDGLTPGTHTVEIVALDQRNVNASDDYIHLDYIDVWDGSAMPDGSFEAILQPVDSAERILRSNNWSQSTSATASDGTYLRNGSSTWFPFTGDTATFQYLAFSSAGQVELLIDGQLQGIFDLYNPTTITRSVSFDGLGSGPHVLHVRAYRGQAVIDSFATPGTAPFFTPSTATGVVRHEENDPAFSYNGSPYLQTSTGWFNGSYSWASRGYAANSRTGGDTLGVDFDGTWVNLGFVTRSNAGLAEIFIDGVSQGTIDTYSRFDSTRSIVYDGLAPGPHTLEVVVTDQRNANATDDWIHVDYIDVWDGTAMPDGTFEGILESYDGDERLTRSNNWAQSNSTTASDGSYLRNGSSVWFPFTGDTVTYRPLVFTSAGQVEIIIDGQSRGTFDLYNPVTAQGAFSFDGLGAGPHVMQIQAFRGQAIVDAFTTPGTPPFVQPPSAATGIVRYEEDQAAFLYNGVPYRETNTTWTYGSYGWSSRGYAAHSRTPNDTVSFDFDGTWVNLGFVTRSSGGQAEILIDGISQGIVDTYSRYDSTINRVFDGLAPGPHTLDVVVLGQRSANSTDNWVRLDYVDIWDGTALPDGTFETVLDPTTSDQRVWRSTNWTSANHATASDGSYLRNGSSAWFPFTGDSVSYQLLAFTTAGIVEVVIDGQTVDLFDLYSPVTEQRTFSFEGLGAGPHILQVKGYRGQAVLDSFTTPGVAPFYTPPAPTGIVRAEENAPGLRYNGVPYFETSTTWTYGSYGWGSRGYAAHSRTANDTVSFDFDGTWVGLGFVSRTSAGQAEIFIDGVSQGIVDTYTASDQTVSSYYEGLADTSHTIEIVVLGQRNASSTDNWIRLDYIDTWDGTPMPTGTFEGILEPFNGDERISRSLNWRVINFADAIQGSYLRDGSTAWFPFTGTSVNYEAIVYNGAGTVEVYIDGVSQGLVTLNNPTAFARPFSYINLPDGPHVLQIRAAGGAANFDGFTTPGTLVKFEPSNVDLSASIGAPNTYPIQVTNFGGITDTFAITAATDGWPVSLNPENVTLAPGAGVVVSATIVVPPTAVLGDTNTVTVSVSSPAQGGFESNNVLNLFAVDVRTQLCLAIDASGSVSGADFNLAKAGLAAAFRDPNTVPRNGTVEISVIQFPLGSGIVELAPTVIVSEASAEAAAQRIEAIVKAGGGTPMEDGVRVCKELIVGSQHFVNAPNQIINLATDGAPNNATATLQERTLAIDAGIDSINAEAIGGANISFLQNSLVYPQPGYLAPPFNDSGNGFVIPISTFEEFADSIQQKLQFVLGISTLDVTHTIPVTGTTVLTNTVTPAADQTTFGADSTILDWSYTLGEGDSRISTLETLLIDMQPGESRVVATGTTVSYTVPGGDSATITLPPLTVAAPHLIALDPPLQTVGTGSTAVYTATLFNLTDNPLDLALAVVGFPANWVGGSGSYTVPANGELPVSLAVSIPADADLGLYSFTAVVTTPTGGQDQAGAQLEVVEGFTVSIVPPVQTVLVGEVATYTVAVENPTPFAETYQLSLSGLNAAAAAALPPSIDVPAGQIGTFELPVTALFPAGLEPFTVQAVDSNGLIGSADALLRIEGETGVALALDPTAQVTGPGAPAHFVVTVTNLGDFIDTFDLDVLLPAGWTYEWLANGKTVDPITLTPAVFNVANLGLLITPPAGTAPSSYPFTVAAVSGINPTANDAVDGTVTVIGSGVTVEIAPESTTVDPLVPAVWNVTVTNPGTAADTFDLSTLGLLGAPGQFSSGSVSLAAGQSTVVQLTIDPPDYLLVGTTYQFEVTATSQTDSRITNLDIADVQVSGVPGVAVEWQPVSQEVEAGNGIDYLLTVSNTGNLPLTYDLIFTVSGGAPDDVTLTPEVSSLELPAGFSGVIRVTANSTATAVGVYALEATATAGVVAASDSATLNVIQLNGPPAPVDDVAVTDEEVPVEVDVLANDSDPDGDPLVVSAVSNPATGEIAITPGNTLAYTPTVDFNGVVTVTYTVDDGQGLTADALLVITVNPVNDEPLAEDDSATTPEETPVVVDVLFNDSDVDGDELTISGVTQPLSGTVGINVDQTVTFTPTLDFNGVVTFTYTISDGAGGSDEALVTVTVTPVNDAPMAVDDTVTTPEDTPVDIDVLANDSDVDGDSLAISAVTQPLNGMVQVTAGSTLLYTPTLNFNGVVTMSYTIQDGLGLTDTAKITVTVVPVNDGPLALDDVATTVEDIPVNIDVLANDTDDDGDVLTVTAVTQPTNGTVAIEADNTVTYSPGLNYNGGDLFTYEIVDTSGITATAQVSITVLPVNDGPLAVDDLLTIDEDTVATLNALANDIDDDGDILAMTTLSQPLNGVATFNADGTVVITPTLNFNGVLTLTYTVTDGDANDEGAIIVTVAPVNDPPVAVDDSGQMDEDTVATFDVLANDSDVDGDGLMILQISTPLNGTAAVNVDQTITYTPTADYNGPESIVYTIQDGNGGSATATLLIDVLPVNDPPVAADDVATTSQGQAVIIDILANDSDIDGDSLTVVVIGQSGDGVANLLPDGSIEFVPNPSFSGPTTFGYTIIDGQGGSASAVVTVTVTPAAACDLYPIALHSDTLAGIQPGDTIVDIFNGQTPGNFGWLSWDGSNGVPTLVDSLTAPGNSGIYVNPNDPNDTALTAGDWVYGRPGVSNSKEVRQSLDNLIGQEIIVPIWSEVEGQGNNTLYQITGFARVKLVGYQLPSQNRITVEYVGPAICGDSSAARPSEVLYS